ncbi:MAG: glycosyltransferase family 87 protein [Candidatus Limnocylindria bacterium]
MRRDGALSRAPETPPGRGLAALAEAGFPWLVVVLVAGYVAITAVSSNLTVPYLAWDSHAYWVALGAADPYAGARVGDIGSFLYPPPFLQLLAPLGRLPWPVFAFGWAAVLMATAIALLRRVPHRFHWLLPLLVWIAAADIWAGNINLLLAYAVVVAMEWPVAWPVVGLTKVTPVIGLLWHLFRREWRATWIAIGLTASLGLLSWVAAPEMWRSWTSQVVFGAAVDGYYQSFPIPLFVRLPLAAMLLWWGARAGRPAMVPLACALALPVIWLNGLALGIGAASLIDVRMRPMTEPITFRTIAAGLREAGHALRGQWRPRARLRAVWDSNPRHED